MTIEHRELSTEHVLRNEGLQALHKRMCLLPIILLGFMAVPNATVLLPADLGELVAGARAIVHGQITEVRIQWIDGRRHIDSFVTVEVTSYFKGDRCLS